MLLQTKRLLLRQWRQEDFPVFAEINADPLAMEYFPTVLSTHESNEIATRLMNTLSAKGWGLWAAELKATKEFIGFVGLSEPASELSFSPCVEVGWRLHPRFWGNGYATEGGIRSLEFAFEELGLQEVVSMTATTNSRSFRVMERLGMTNTHNNFFHPNVPRESAVAEHVLYTINREAWESSRG